MEIIDKHFDVGDVLVVARALRDLGIGFRPNFMLGLPGEREADTFATLDLARDVIRINPTKNPILYMYQPIPSTALYRKEMEMGVLPKPPTLEEWASRERSLYWEQAQCPWAANPDVVEGYRVEERRRTRRIAFYFWLGYMFGRDRRGRRRRKRGLLNRLVVALCRMAARARYSVRCFCVPVEWALFRRFRASQMLPPSEDEA
jgi:radical SAM superfamily enzyme YgiQ (UPF0313 family)